MLLGVIPMICVEILSDSWRKSGIFEFLRRNVGNPRRGVKPTLQRSPTLQRGMPSPRRGQGY